MSGTTVILANGQGSGGLGAGERGIAVEAGVLRVTTQPTDVLVAYGLGSCIGVALVEPRAKLAGLAHISLPSRSAAGTAPRFAAAEDALPELAAQVKALGGDPRRARIVLVGGAQILDPGQFFQIGRRNYFAVKQTLWKLGLLVQAEHVGGSDWRTLFVHTGSGQIRLRTREGLMELTDGHQRSDRR